MSNRLKLIAAFSLGVTMTCTLITAHAADYRKETRTRYTVIEKATAVDSYTYSLHYDLSTFLVPDNQFVFTPKVSYLFPVNEPKPHNRSVNGLINNRREQERISIGLRY